MTLTGSGTDLSTGIGGLIGQLGRSKQTVIRNITFANVKITAENATAEQSMVGGLIGRFGGGSVPESVVIENIQTIENIHTRGTETAALEITASAGKSGGIGGLIGMVCADVKYELPVRNISLTKVKINAKGVGTELAGAGLLLGCYGPKIGFDFTISNVRVGGTITVTAGNVSTGALIGSVGWWYTIKPNDFAGNLNVTVNDAVIEGTINGADGCGKGMVIGAITIPEEKEKVIVLNNVLFKGTVVGEKAGLIVGKTVSGDLDITMMNCSAVENSVPFGGDFGTFAVKLNGKDYTANGAFNEQRDSLAIVSASEAEAIVTYNGAYVENVDGHLVGGFEQHTDVYQDSEGNDVYDVRFVIVAHVDQEDGYQVTVRVKTTDNEEDNDVIFNKLPCEAYDTLIGYGELGEYRYTIEESNGKKFIAVVVRCVPANVAYDFDITASYTTESGIVMTDVTRTLSVTAGNQFLSEPVA